MRPSLLTWLCTSLSAGLPRWSFLALLPLSCFKHVWHRFLGCLSLLCGASHALFLFLFLSSSSVVGSRSATSYLATPLLSARGLHHCIRRLSCGLIEVGLRSVLDLAASRRLGHLCLLLHLWSHCNFLRHLDLFLKLRHVEEFPVSSIHLGHLSCRAREANVSGFSHCNHTLLVQLSVSVWFQKLKFNLAGETGNRASKFALSRSCCSL